MSNPIEENKCDECGKVLTWGEYKYSMNHFKRCMQSGNGLCQSHQKEQRLKEQPEKLATFMNLHLN